MSFDYNPYEHIEVLHLPHGNYKLYCHSCGAEWGDFIGAATVRLLFAEMAVHVVKSHGRTRSDFQDWSIR
jgi:SAM-dependent MidA family methyltransferase